MRALLMAGVLATLSACSAEPEAASPSGAPGSGAAVADDGTIECALRGAEKFVRECPVERARQGDALDLVVRHPDGGFRRFEVLKDGRGVAVADGAKAAETRIAGDILEVTVDKDRYRFPATRKPHAQGN